MAVRKTPKPKRTADDSEQYKRQHRESFRLNDLEYNALMKYYKKYKVRNRARFLREAIMSIVLKKFDEDYPTLFDNMTPAEPQQQEQRPDKKGDAGSCQLILDL